MIGLQEAPATKAGLCARGGQMEKQKTIKLTEKATNGLLALAEMIEANGLSRRGAWADRKVLRIEARFLGHDGPQVFVNVSFDDGVIKAWREPGVLV